MPHFFFWFYLWIKQNGYSWHCKILILQCLVVINCNIPVTDYELKITTFPVIIIRNESDWIVLYLTNISTFYLELCLVHTSFFWYSLKEYLVQWEVRTEHDSLFHIWHGFYMKHSITMRNKPIFYQYTLKIKPSSLLKYQVHIPLYILSLL